MSRELAPGNHCIARAVLLRSLFVERWAPKGVYVLDRLPDGTFSITEEETGTALGSVSASSPAALPGATFTLLAAATEYDQIIVSIVPSIFANASTSLTSSGSAGVSPKW